MKKSKKLIRKQSRKQEYAKSEKGQVVLSNVSEQKKSYEALYIHPSDIIGRQEKTIYLRGDYYERINSIIQLYKNPRLSVFAYVDAVLEQHFEAHKKDIKEVHNKLYKAPYDE